MIADNRDRGLTEMRNKIIMRHHAAGRCPKDIARRMRNTIYGKQLTEGRIRESYSETARHRTNAPCAGEEQEQETNWETSNNNENYSNEYDSYQ